MYVEVVFVTLFKNRPFEAGWVVSDSDISSKWQTLMQKQHTATEERAEKFYSLF